MKTILVAVIVTLVLAATTSACKSKPGSREFIPGKGWVETK